MNIKEAKTEIRHTVEAYTRKNESGEYCIPRVRQRPVLLIGPPGIGKTAIMEQIAKECGIGLVSYTITHHTRQSAVGLPVVVHKTYQGQEYTVTEYTMSEIISSVYECMEKTGCREGILFIDEINCVSETLSPTMLQFLQNKTFGTHAVPRGWVIVAAGNPREYNKSVREFDVVTLDRVKKIEVQEDFSAWKEYAMERNIHPAILGYLQAKTENFYHVEIRAKEKYFVTARGWEDLSVILNNYEEMGISADETLIRQYLQEPKISADFASYYELYTKYQKDYRIPEILDGTLEKEAYEKQVQMAGCAEADERLMIESLILGVWDDALQSWNRQEIRKDAIREALQKEWKQTENGAAVKDFLEQETHAFEVKQTAGLLTAEEEMLSAEALKALKRYHLECEKEHLCSAEEELKKTKELFAEEENASREVLQKTQKILENGFTFAEDAFGAGIETTLLASDLAANPLGAQFLQKYGCEQYFRFSGDVQYTNEQEKLKKEISAILLKNESVGNIEK